MPVAELQEMMRRLHNIRKAEKELDIWFQVRSAANPQPRAKQPKTTPMTHTKGRGANTAEEWKLAIASPCSRKRPSLKSKVPLQNCFTALQTEEERPVLSGETLELSKAAQSDRTQSGV